MTQREIEKEISTNGNALRDLKSIVMISCVGSRDNEHPYCSRVCCSTAIKNALLLKKINPQLQIFMLYRDVRSYGLREIFYKQAREAGIIFVHHDQNHKPEVVIDNGRLVVEIDEHIMKRRLRLTPDLLVLNTGIVPNDDNKYLSQALKVPLGTDGFFFEAHVKLRPVDFATDGIFMCGLAHYPKDLSESIVQAKAAASRAVTVLSRDEIESEGKVAFIDEKRCNGCELCVHVCAYSAIELDSERGIAVVNEALCKGCGTCTASCRSSAIDLKGFRDAQILAALGAL